MILPKAIKLVPYISYATPSGQPNGVLHVFGDASSSKIALLCAGFPDDHTIFLPFAEALSKHGIMAGVMCLPGYDDRPEDGIPFQSHPRKGFTFDETAKAVREASRSLRETSIHENPEFIGIFHDWGVVAGTLWAERLEKEAQDNPKIRMPNKIVFFDVMGPPSSKMSNYIHPREVKSKSIHEKLSYLYQFVFAISSMMQRCLPRIIAAAFAIFGYAVLTILRISPLKSSDFNSVDAIYGDRKPGLARWASMMYMYLNIFTSDTMLRWRVHRDWKKTPILYMYGKKKRTHFHSNNVVAMLKREEVEQRSLCRVVPVEGAGHWLYVQEHELCLKHVLDFIQAENTFAM